MQYLPGFPDHVAKRCFSGLTATFGSRELSLKSIFKASGRKIIFYVFNLSLINSKVSLVLSQEAPYCVTADKNCVPNKNARKSFLEKC